MLQLVAVSLAISLISVRVSKSLYMIRSSNASMYCANYQGLDNLAFSEPPREPAPLYVHPRPFFLSLVLSQLPVTIVRHQIRVPLDRPAVRDWSGLGPAAFDVPKQSWQSWLPDTMWWWSSSTQKKTKSQHSQNRALHCAVLTLHHGSVTLHTYQE